MLKHRNFLLFILLLLVGIGLGTAYVHWSKRFRSKASDAPFTVTQLEVKRDFANAILTLTIDYDNREGIEEITTAGVADDPTGARLVTSSGKAPPLFFLPGTYPPVVSSGERKEITMIYWLESDHLSEGLRFESKGKSVAVKNDTAFDLTQIGNQESVVFTDPNWSH